MNSCNVFTDTNGRKVAVCRIELDPATLSTSQQKMIDFRRHRVFQNKKVLAGMRAVSLIARTMTSRIHEVVPFRKAVTVDAEFYYSYPKGTPKKDLIEKFPMPSGADCENRWKSVGDALTQAEWWEDDRLITHLGIDKFRTIYEPRIVIRVSRDDRTGITAG